ncbi:MAG: hypothetical protein WAU59_20065 [Rhodoplanes sp.]
MASAVPCPPSSEMQLAKVAEPNAQVLPHCAQIHSVEPRSDFIVKSQLLVSRERLFDRRNQDVVIVLRRDLPFRANGDNIVGKSFHQRDHGATSLPT